MDSGDDCHSYFIINFRTGDGCNEKRKNRQHHCPQQGKNK